MYLSPNDRKQFVADRMLGTLCRYLRFMGYDTISANSLSQGNTLEDTILLQISKSERRILLTRDRELANRAGVTGILISSDDVIEQVKQLVNLELIDPELRMTRCSLCNTELQEATTQDIMDADYAPKEKTGLTFYSCHNCHKLYWNGSHGKHLADRIEKNLSIFGISGK
ncbi:MAG: Mut7-C RNAse domain-containing protein [Methanoregulaceae archaeon]